MRGLISGLMACVVVSICGCRSTVQVAVPPRVDLSAYRTVGLVEFTSNSDQNLQRFTTDRFIQAVHSHQPGTRVLELGSEREVLSAVRAPRLDVHALKAIREHYGVDAVIVGNLLLEEARPSVAVSGRNFLKSVNARADVNAALTARLIETDSGATLWTDSANTSATIAHAGWSGRGFANFGASDPEAIYGEMVANLVHHITDDFRVRYERRVVRSAAVEP